MKKILNALMLLCAVLLVGCATTHIMNPESVACVNFGSGTGLTANEVTAMKELGDFVKIATLGELILRTETAGTVATALCMYELGGLGNHK